MISYFALVVVLLLLILLAYLIYKGRRQISSLSDLPPDISGVWLRGIVVSVGDGDGFKFFHVPWLRLAEYNGEPTLKIRLAGIDAPELPSFGNPGQPFAVEAKEELKELVLNKIVNLKLLRVDQYDRILATCYKSCLWGLFNTTNVNKKMVELGLACVYRGRDAIYDDYKNDLFYLQDEARENGIGMWSQDHCVSPMQYKKEHRDRK